MWFAGDERGPVLAEALHKAHFTDGQDIGSVDVLTAVAVETGLNEAAVRAFLASDEGVAEVQAEIDAAHQLGISSVPTFVFAGKYAVSGAQDPDVLRADASGSRAPRGARHACIGRRTGRDLRRRELRRLAGFT